MRNSQVVLIIAHMYLIGAFLVDNVIEWMILLILSIMWMLHHFWLSKIELDQMERIRSYKKMIVEKEEQEKKNRKRRGK